jgi:arylsulfatase
MKPLWLAFWVVLLGPVFAEGQMPKPNVVFILADDLGFSDLGCYGSEIATPHLDALAAGGLRFSQMYNTARCWPSRAALLSGYYAQQIHRDKFPNVPGGGVGGVRPAWAKLLPESMKSAGYRSYHSGKWHIDGKVLASGFDQSLNIANPGNMFTARGSSLNDVPRKPPANESGYYLTVATADHAVECLKQHAEKNPRSPFFSYIAFHAPHFPLHALPQDIAKYQGKYDSGWEAVRKARYERQKTLGFTGVALSPPERDLQPPYQYPKDLEKLGQGEVDRALPWEKLTPEQKRFQATKM